jgi:zinc protease
VYDEAHLNALRGMTMILDSRLFDTIRQELGGTYSISAVPRTQKRPQPAYTLQIDWTSDPTRMPMLVQRVFDEIRFVRDTPLSAQQVERLRAALMRDDEQRRQTNGYFLNEIARFYQNGDAARVAEIAKVRERIASLTGDEVQQAARTYLDFNNYVQVTLVPEPQ